MSSNLPSKLLSLVRDRSPSKTWIKTTGWLSAAVENLVDVRWLISYDNVPQIIEMYRGYRMSSFNLNYTLQSKKFGSELLVFSPDLVVGNEIQVNSRNSELVLF